MKPERQCGECGQVSRFRGRRCDDCMAELDAMRAPYVQALLEGVPQAELKGMPEPAHLTADDIYAEAEARGVPYAELYRDLRGVYPKGWRR